MNCQLRFMKEKKVQQLLFYDFILWDTGVSNYRQHSLFADFLSANSLTHIGKNGQK